MTEETYLGDGLYVSTDGWDIILRAPRAGGSHWVALGPDTWTALVVWIKTWPTVHPAIRGHANE